MATVVSPKGKQFVVPDSVEADYLAQGFTRPGQVAPVALEYSAMKVADLKSLIGERNAGRDEVDLIPTDGKKADMVAALEADDAREPEPVEE
jgi:hypothetical protein